AAGARGRDQAARGPLPLGHLRLGPRAARARRADHRPARRRLSRGGALRQDAALRARGPRQAPAARAHDRLLPQRRAAAAPRAPLLPLRVLPRRGRGRRRSGAGIPLSYYDDDEQQDDAGSAPHLDPIGLLERRWKPMVAGLLLGVAASVGFSF